MQFKALTLLAAALSVSHVSAQLGPDDVLDNIHKITDLSSDLADTAQSVQSGTGLFTAAPKVVSGFKDIISTVTKTITTMDDNEPSEEFSEDDQNKICGAFRDFVKVHQNLLKIVIGKGSILSSTPFASIIASILRTLEGGVDKLAFGIIDMVPTCADGAKSDLDDLDGTIGDAIDEYS